MSNDERPFSNGTEGQAWMDVWCAHCANDHTMHSVDDREAGPEGFVGCQIIGASMIGGDDWRWPEAWIKPPPDLDNHLPSLMLCGMFTACEPCGGDPLSEVRINVIRTVEQGWRDERQAAALAGIDQGETR